MTNVEALRAQAARYRREMAISGPRDRLELERLAMREERLANQLECERRLAEPRHEVQQLFTPAPAVIPGQTGFGFNA